MSGRFDRRIQFQRAEIVDNGLNSARTWFDDQRDNLGDPVWARKEDVSDGERWRAGEVSAQITTRFLVRRSAFTASVTPADRLVCEGVTYNITGIKEPMGRHQLIEITGAARNAVQA